MDEQIPRISVDSEDRHSIASLHTGPRPSRSIGSRRPSSVTSNLSASGYRVSSTSTSFSSLLANNLHNSHNRLAANSIADLVDSVVPGTNPPTPRRSGTAFFKPPTSSDIPTVKLTPTPKMSNAELVKFSTEISRDFDQFYNHQMSKRSANDDDTISVSAISDDTDNLPSGARSPRYDTSQSSIASQTIREPSPINPLSDVPAVFFEQESFQLDNPKVFEAVSEQQHTSVSGHDHGDLSDTLLGNSSILQEKLSWHIDTVELHLIREISKASQSFFSTLDELQSINEKASTCLSNIRRLRKELADVDENVALKGLQRLKQGMIVHNTDSLLHALGQISLIMEKTAYAKTLLDQENAEQCLDTLDAIECIVAGNDHDKNALASQWASSEGLCNSLIDMRTVHSLNDVREHLRTLRTKAGESYNRSFVKILIEDINAYLDNADRTVTLQRLGHVLERDRRISYERTPRTSMDEPSSENVPLATINSSSSTAAPSANDSKSSDLELRSKLSAQLQGLDRSNGVVNAFGAYKEAVLKLGKSIVRSHLPTRDNDDTMSLSSNSTSRSVADRTMSLGTALRNMTDVEAQTMITSIYTQLSDLYLRLGMQQKLLLDLVSSLSSDAMVVVLDVRDVVQDVISNSESYMVKILRARKDQFTRQSLQMFMNFYTLNGVYLTNCEAIRGDPCRNLNVLLGSMIKQFLASFAQSRDAELAKCMDEEIWKETEITKDMQQTVDNLVESAEVDPEPWVSSLKKVLDSGMRNGDANVNANGNSIEPNNSDKKVLPKNIFVGNLSFIVTKSAITMTKFVEEYLQLCVLLPHLSPETGRSLATLIRRYNSRATRLILQAGATRSGTLKHITAKHLSLSSESMHIMIALIPYIKACVQRHLPGGSNYDILEFDTIAADLVDHRQEIHNKFVSLMSDKMRYHCQTIAKIDWSESPPSSEEGKPPTAHPYTQSISKETTVLVKIITRLLPRETAVHITSLIFDTYKRLLIETYTQAKIRTATEKANMLRDIDYLRENLGNLEGAGNALQVIWENVNNIAVDSEAQTAKDNA